MNVRPAVNGTYYLAPLHAHYTAGEPHIVARALARILSSSQPVACDIESYGLGLDARRLKCVSIANTVESVVLDPRGEAGADLVRRTLSLAGQLVFHNSAFDIPNLFASNLIGLPEVAKVSDTLIYARLAYPDVLVRKSLEALAKLHLGIVTEETIKLVFRRLGMTIKEGYASLDIDAPAYLMGAAVDALVTARLLPYVRQAALSTLTAGHPYRETSVTGVEADRLVEREQRINRMLLRRACKGFRVDLDFLDRYRDANSKARYAAEADLSAAGIRPGNGNDLVKVLEAADAIPADHPRTAKTDRPSTVAAHLEMLAHPLAELFVSVKQVTKVESDYLAKVTELAIDDSSGWPRIHPTVNLLAATTGRSSMGDPPLHQFPGPARGIILADPGDCLVSIDWAQIEPVLTANIAGDLPILAGYEDGSSDLYSDLASFASIPRKTAKVVLLAQMYGEGIRKLAADLRTDQDTARTYREHIFDAMPRVSRLLFRLRELGRAHRKIFTLSGRILTVPMGRPFEEGGPVSVATHKAINYFVQGGAYDLLAEAMIAVDSAGLGDAIYLGMHDEMVVSQSAAHDIEAIMATPPPRLVELAGRVPILRTDSAVLGERWAAA